MTDTTDNATTSIPEAAPENNGQQSTLLGAQGEQQQQATDTLLGGQQEEQQQAAAPEKYAFPEKFQVKQGDELDFDASVRKLGEAYTNLEKRFGAGDARPADVTGYKFDAEFGENFADHFLQNPDAKQFLQEAFDLGMNNAQVNYFIKQAVQAQPTQAEAVAGMSPQQAQEVLQKEWAQPADYTRNMQAADRAARSLLKQDYPAFINKYGNDPAIIRMLAAVGGEMGEDAMRLAGTPIASADSIDEMMASEAYRNERHPDHVRVSKQVRDYFNRVAGTDEIR